MEKVIKKLCKFTTVLAKIYLILLFAAVFLQIILRNFFNMGSRQIEEFARYCSVSTVFLMIGVIALRRNHIVVDMAIKNLPNKSNAIISAIADLISAGFIASLLFSIKLIMKMNWNVRTPGMGMLNAVYYISITFGLSIALIAFLYSSYRWIKDEPGSKKI